MGQRRDPSPSIPNLVNLTFDSNPPLFLFPFTPIDSTTTNHNEIIISSGGLILTRLSPTLIKVPKTKIRFGSSSKNILRETKFHQPSSYPLPFHPNSPLHPPTPHHTLPTPPLPYIPPRSFFPLMNLANNRTKGLLFIPHPHHPPITFHNPPY